MGIRYINYSDYSVRLNESKKFFRDEGKVEFDLDKCNRIAFYKTNSEKIPVRDFLMSIADKKLYQETIENILKLDREGRDAKFPLVYPMGDGILELRTSSNRNQTRIFYFFDRDDTIVMTNGYIKKTQKADLDELQKAKKYHNDFDMKSFRKHCKNEKMEVYTLKDFLIEQINNNDEWTNSLLEELKVRY